MHTPALIESNTVDMKATTACKQGVQEINEVKDDNTFDKNKAWNIVFKNCHQLDKNATKAFYKQNEGSGQMCHMEKEKEVIHMADNNRFKALGELDE